MLELNVPISDSDLTLLSEKDLDQILEKVKLVVYTYVTDKEESGE